MKRQIDKSSPRVHDLVLFKTKNDTHVKEIDRYSFERIDQENKIKLVTDYRPFGSHFQYSIFIDNQSLALITEIKIKIKFPFFFILSRYFPPTTKIPNLKTEKNVKQINFEFDKLNEENNEEIHLHFTPESLENIGEIRTIVTYVNNKNTIRVLDSGSTKVTVDKINIEPKVVPSSYVREFSQTPGIKKAIKSMGVGINYQIESEIYFEILEKILYDRFFQLVTKDLNKKILWYFGTESIVKKDVLVIGQIISNKIELIALSQNQYLLISVLTQISNDFKNHLISNRFVDSKFDFYDLECKNCGAILPYFPQKMQKIACINCNFQQVIW